MHNLPCTMSRPLNRSTSIRCRNGMPMPNSASLFTGACTPFRDGLRWFTPSTTLRAARLHQEQSLRGVVLERMRIEGSPTQAYHREHYGADYDYYNFAPIFDREIQKVESRRLGQNLP